MWKAQSMSGGGEYATEKKEKKKRSDRRMVFGVEGSLMEETTSEDS